MIIEVKDSRIVGKFPLKDGIYEAFSVEEGTLPQNSTFHALLGELFLSGHDSYPAKNFDQLKDYVKRDLGAGFESYIYADLVNGKPKIYKVNKKDDIPRRILNDKDLSSMVLGKLKSWADYTKVERQQTIDRLIAYMLKLGIQSRGFFAILEGIENAKLSKAGKN